MERKKMNILARVGIVLAITLASSTALADPSTGSGKITKYASVEIGNVPYLLFWSTNTNRLSDCMASGKKRWAVKASSSHATVLLLAIAMKHNVLIAGTGSCAGFGAENISWVEVH